MAEKITCKGCKKPIVRYYPDNYYLGCTFCNAVNYAPPGKPVELVSSSRKVSSDNRIQIGDKARFGGKDFRVVTKFKYKANYKEYDKEDKVYTSEVWISYEWLLMSDDGHSMWLYSDEEGVARFEEYPPIAPILPKSGKMIRFGNTGRAYRIMEYGRKTIQSMNGEYPSKLLPGEEYNFSMFKYDGEVEIEWQKKGKRYSEISFYKSKPVGGGELIKAFKHGDPGTGTYKLARKLDRTRFIALSALVMGVLLFLAWAMVGSGTTIISDQTYIGTDKDQVGQETKVFNLTAGKTYEFFVSSNFDPDNTSIDLEIDVLDAATDELINIVGVEYYRSSGRDSDGDWTENNLSDSEVFIAEQSGTYKFRVRVLRTTTAQTGTVSLRMSEQFYKGYFFYAYILFFALAGLSFLSYRSMYKKGL